MSEIDGYWLRMGHLAVDTLMAEGIIKDLSPEQIGSIAEWVGGLLGNAHDMGMRLGETRGRFAAEYKRIAGR